MSTSQPNPFNGITLRLSLILFLYMTSSCALYPSSSSAPIVTTACLIPSDQSGTISGRWLKTPIPIAFHQGDFSSAEMTAMTQAADTWNQFYTASKSVITLDYGGSATNPRTSTVADPSGSTLCTVQGILQALQFIGNVVIYKLGAWPSNYPSSAIALTSFCTNAASPYNTMYMAVMEVNYQSFFVNGNKVPDLQSIILHELGHLHGLNHSCEATAKTGFPNCNSTTLDPSYNLASMYPVFGFDASGAGQIKSSLGTNDEERANCLYPTTSPTP